MPTPSSRTAPPPARARTRSTVRRHVGDPLVPVVVHVGERLAVGRRPVAPLCEGSSLSLIALRASSARRSAPPLTRPVWQSGRVPRSPGASGHTGARWDLLTISLARPTPDGPGWPRRRPRPWARRRRPPARRRPTRRSTARRPGPAGVDDAVAPARAAAADDDGRPARRRLQRPAGRGPAPSWPSPPSSSSRSSCVVAFLNRNALEDLDRLLEETLANTGTSPSATIGSTWGSILSIVGSSLGQTLIAAGLAIMVVAWYSGSRPGLGEILRTLRRRSPALAVAWLCIHLLELVGALRLRRRRARRHDLLPGHGPDDRHRGASGPFRGHGPGVPARGPALLVRARLRHPVRPRRLDPRARSSASCPSSSACCSGRTSAGSLWASAAIITQMVATTVVGASTALLYLDLRIRQEGLDLAWAADRHLPAVNADDIRQLADDILARPEFRQPEPNLLERAPRLGRGPASVTSSRRPSPAVPARWWAGSSCSPRCGLIIWFATRFGRTVQVGGRVGHRGRGRPPPVAGGSGGPRPRSTRRPGSGRRPCAAATGRWSGTWSPRGSWTTWPAAPRASSARDVTDRAPDRAEAFAAATELFELAWYADRPTGPDENARFQALAGHGRRGCGREPVAALRPDPGRRPGRSWSLVAGNPDESRPGPAAVPGGHRPLGGEGDDDPARRARGRGRRSRPGVPERRRRHRRAPPGPTRRR